MEAQSLNVKRRTNRGKGAARSMRREGRVPGVVYGPKMKPEMISLDAREVEKAVGYQTRTQLMKLLSNDLGISEKLVLVKEVQRHPLTRSLIHTDLYEVDVNQRLNVEVPLNFVGKAAGVELGGILQPVRRSIEVLCLPLQIPEELEVDVSALGIHDAVHISDLKPPEGVEIPFDADVTLVTVLPPVVEETRQRLPTGRARKLPPKAKKERPKARRRRSPPRASSQCESLRGLEIQVRDTLGLATTRASWS